ncbi:hypothetical protein F5Y13DRAFT_192699 [Hypoxylon sp. FL1857]|nr:hypothetical protein F5Y13DRAFT_192699 [Hypoxylon sp. FL1857]
MSHLQHDSFIPELPGGIQFRYNVAMPQLQHDGVILLAKRHHTVVSSGRDYAAIRPGHHSAPRNVASETRGTRTTRPRQYSIGHNPIRACTESTCIECLSPFQNTTQLNKHAKDTSHRSYGCTCRATFCRLDALTRHLSGHSSDLPKYPCEYCTLNQGANGFHRHDHLIQHLKGYHKIDVENKLPRRRTRSSPASVSVATAVVTMGESATPQAQVPSVPCPLFGCIEGGANGYLRQIDLFEHQNTIHPVATQNFTVMPQFVGDMHFDQNDTMSQFPNGMQFHQDVVMPQFSGEMQFDQNGTFQF